MNSLALGRPVVGPKLAKTLANAGLNFPIVIPVAACLSCCMDLGKCWRPPLEMLMSRTDMLSLL